MIEDIDIAATLEQLRSYAGVVYDISDEELASYDDEQRALTLAMRAAYKALDRGDMRELERLLAQQMTRVLLATAGEEP
jgi:hypothetical protein